MSNIPGACSYREEQIWNRIFRWGRKTVQVEPVYKRTPSIREVLIENANKEVEIQIPPDTKSFKLRIRGSSHMKISYVEGGTSAGPFWSVGLHGIYVEENLNLDQEGSPLSIFVQIDKANRVLEILEWN